MPLNAEKPEKKKSTKKVIKLDRAKEPLVDIEGTFDPEDVIFSLDIGTRTVVGIVGVPEKDYFKVIAAEVVEHRNRAMLDGQIHDIRQVAEIAQEVKEKLEKDTGIKLTKVAIAAAGRVLKTCEVKVEREIEQGREINQEMISSIEMEAIQQAQLKLDEEVAKDEKTQFYCVGYSVINYYLNGYIISSLLGHKGKKLGIDILATFLPHIVVDSLYTVMNRIGLEVISLTLEPIAALNVTIPKDLRLLNLALVDIGAGTSDIAITKDGTVVAYAMAPIAGDEITEKIAQSYLVDFITGERIKIALSSNPENVTFVDILGKKNVVKASDVAEVIKPSVEHLAETISQKILEYNHKAPNAVFLIGGGSQVNGLTELIGEHLKLPKERVVVRGRDIIQNVKYKGKKLNGPEAITPFGIAVTAQMQRGQDFLSVSVNGTKVRLFNSKRLTVADALILVGYNPSQLIGRTGKSVTFELNGIKRTIRGEHGKPAEIFVNEKPANIETVLDLGDSITINPAVDGKNAEVYASDFVKNVNKAKITLNGTVVDISTKVFINAKFAPIDCLINDSDSVEIHEISTLGELLKATELDLEGFIILVNGEEADGSYNLSDGDEVMYRLKSLEAEEKTDEVSYEEASIEDDFANEEVIPEMEAINSPEPEQTVEVLPETDASTNSISVFINGKSTVLSGNKKNYIFVDIFNYIDFDLSKPQGNIVLLLNGRSAAFADEIRNGDMIEVLWR